MAALLLGLLGSGGCTLTDTPDARLSWPVHLLLLAAGFAAGIMATLRCAEIDRRRFEIAGDSQITAAEREYAHKDAEGKRRRASTLFLLAPLILGYAFGAHLRIGNEEDISVNLLMMTPALAFFFGMLFGRRYERPPEL